MAHKRLELVPMDKLELNLLIRSRTDVRAIRTGGVLKVQVTHI